MRCYVTLSNVLYVNNSYIDVQATTGYVILLLVFNTVCYDYLRSNLRGFHRLLIHDNYVSSLYTQCLSQIKVYNIRSTWFLDIRVSTCLHLQYILFVILVSCIYKGYAHNFLAKGYQLRKSMDIRYNMEKYLCYCSNLVCFSQKVDMYQFRKLVKQYGNAMATG